MACKDKDDWFFYGTVEKMLDEFTSQFTKKPIPYIKIGTRFFLENKQLQPLLLSKGTLELFGYFLGEIKKKQFFPSFNLLDLLSEISDESVIVNEWGEIDFLYGKHLRKRHIIDIQGSLEKDCLKLVKNQFDETLGYGRFLGFSEKKAQIVKHVLDRGVFIKRDKHQG